MTNIISYAQTDLYDPVTWSSEITDWSSSRIDLIHDEGSAVFRGHGFSWDEASQAWYGTATSYTDYDIHGDLTIEITDFAQPAWLFQYDWQTIFDTLLAGPDEIILNADSDDVILARGGDDLIYSHRGAKYIDGGEGMDMVFYQSSSYDYAVTRAGADELWVQGHGSNDRLVSVERVDFADGTLAFDERTAEIYRLYQAAFDRTPDDAGLSYWVDRADTGTGLLHAAQSFMALAEFRSLYGPDPSEAEFIDLLYLNVLDREADQAGYDYWAGEMAAGLSEADLLVHFSQSGENVENTEDALWNGVWLA